jgi:two-component system response regulator RegA
MSAGAILLVDDDEVFRDRLARALRERGQTVVTACDAATAMAVSAEAQFAYAVLDLRMPGASGLDLLTAIRRQNPTMRIVVLTGYGSIVSAVDAMARGAHNYLSKPADADDIMVALTSDRPTSDAQPVDARATPPPSLARAEWEHIQRILADCGGNVSEASRRLGITRRTLQFKLKKDPPRA